MTIWGGDGLEWFRMKRLTSCKDISSYQRQFDELSILYPSYLLEMLWNNIGHFWKFRRGLLNMIVLFFVTYSKTFSKCKFFDHVNLLFCVKNLALDLLISHISDLELSMISRIHSSRRVLLPCTVSHSQPEARPSAFLYKTPRSHLHMSIHILHKPISVFQS